MANLGTIAIKNCTTTRFGNKSPRSFAVPSELLSAARDGEISGTVTVGGSPVARARVVLFSRQSLKPLEQVESAANGVYAFTDLISATSEYFVVAFYPEDVAAHNAIIFDKITPV